VAKTAKTGLEALLRPEDSTLVLIDHQPYHLTYAQNSALWGIVR